MMTYGLLGEKLGHSYSKPIHEALGRYSYELYPVSREALSDLLQRREFKGLNVTIPYKRDVLPYCDHLSGEVQAVGSANTLVARNGQIWAYNTDIGGFTSLSLRLGVDAVGRKAAVLGSGGASRSAVYALHKLGAREVIVVSRKGPVDYEALYRSHADAEILVNATPVGMYPDTLVSPVSLDRLPHLKWVLDMIYNPARTRLLLDAEKRGIPCQNGLWMLVAQAMEAAEHFTGERVPPEKTEEIYRRLQRDMLNVILIGMPGCGKTTLGRALARDMGRPFIDCDREIEKRTGETPEAIINARGEAAFRQVETEVLKDICKGSGQVVATGGGAVTVPQNQDILRQNGVILHIQRPLPLLATEGRPLSARLEALEKARMPLYTAWAQAQISNTSDTESAVRAAREAYHEAVGD